MAYTKIKQRFQSRACLAAAVLVFASAAIAQTTTSVTLTGTGDNATLGEVYVDPYTATVGGLANTTVICDDWSNNSYVDESWMAAVINAATVGSSGDGPMFGNNQTLYNELAWLGSQLLANPTNATTQTEVSFAMWDLTYGVNNTAEESPGPFNYLCSTLGGTYSSSGNACSGLTSASTTEYQGALNFYSTAQSSETNYNAAGWEILTPTGDGYVSGTNMGVPQEFLVYTPEPPGVILFAADMLGLMSLGFLFRRRLLRPIR